MKKMSALILGVVLSFGLLTGCGTTEKAETAGSQEAVEETEAAGSSVDEGTVAESAAEEESATHVITDGVGNEVEVPVEISSYIVTAGPYSQVAWALDGGSSERLIGQMVNMVGPSNQTFYEKYDPNFMNSLTDAIGPAGMGVNVEELVAMHPDVVFVWETETAEMEQLEAAGVPTVVLSASDNVINQAEVMAKVLGPEAEERAAKIRQRYDETMAMMEERTATLKDEDRPGALYLQTSQLSIGAAGASFTDYFNGAGGVNVAADATGEGAMAYWQTVDMEQIMAWNPDVIYLSHFDTFVPEDLYSNKIEGQDWSNISAVKNHRVYSEPMDAQMWIINYAQLPLYMEFFAKTMQPELFEDMDLIKDTQDFYKEIYNIDLSEEDAAYFFLLDVNGMTIGDLQ